MKEYKDTLLMPKTDFPMRGNLGVNEIPIQKKWEEDKIYEKVLKKNEGKQPFYLHDGPPYANGKIHVGHAMNKILKDILIRYKTMNGFYSPYLPGWDTHGLPIETALSKNKKINRKEMPIAEFRNLCEKYALEQVELQKVGFKRLGILGEWEHPYITLHNHYEAEQIRCFGIMASKNLIFKGLKPVYWSPSSETALAEAEIEYRDVKSSSIYVAFKVVDGKNVLSNNCELIIWTTTPWTMPANLAICVSPTIEYSVVEADGRYFVMANPGSVLAMLPDMLLGIFTGKTQSLGLKENLLPIASIVAGIFVKNPMLKMLLIGLGGANLLNKAGHEALGKERTERNGNVATTDKKVQYRRYPDEPLNPRIVNPVLQGNTLIATIDHVPCTVQLNSTVADAYRAGALPLNTLANAVLVQSDRLRQMASQNYDNGQQETIVRTRGIQ